MRVLTRLFAAAGVWSQAVAYEELFGYMPVSDVLEHGQMVDECRAFFDKLTGDELNYADAKHIYEHGAGASCKSTTNQRTLMGFAQKDLSGESYHDAFNPKPNWNEWFHAALDGTGDFEGLSDLKRVTSLKKGIMGLMTWYASHELELAIEKAEIVDTRSDSASGHAWDEGWAFYRSTYQHGEDTPWEVAKKRDVDFPDGYSVHTKIAKLFNKGLKGVRPDTYSKSQAQEARDAIYSAWAITYLRAALKYLELAEHTYNDKAAAEGYAYYKAVDGWVSSKNSTAGDAMRKALKITQTEIAAGTYCEAKELLEGAYNSLGLDCSSMGTFKGSVIDCPTDGCGPDEIIPDGEGAVSQVDGVYAEDKECVPEEDHDHGGDSNLSVSNHPYWMVALVILVWSVAA